MSNNSDFSTPERAVISVVVALISYLTGKFVSDKKHEKTYAKQSEKALKIKEMIEAVKRGNFKNISLYKLTRDMDLYNSSKGKDPVMRKGEIVLVIHSDEDFHKVVRINTGETGYVNKKFCWDWIKINTAEDIGDIEYEPKKDNNIIVLSRDIDLYNSSKGKDPKMNKGELVRIISCSNGFYRVVRINTGETGYINKKFID